MDGIIGKILINVVGLGIETTFSEMAASRQHARELDILDRRLERTVEIAKAQDGSTGTRILSTVDTTTKPLPDAGTRPPTCRLSEEDGALDMPTTAETVTALKERLVKELYRIELDLQGGGRIAGKPCDCLSKKKHSSGIEATAEELMSYDKSPLYGQIITWFKQRAPEFEPAKIAKHEPGYYQSMTPEIRNFRKQLEI